MGHLEGQAGAYFIVADTDAERALLRHAARTGELTLLDGIYHVVGETVRLSDRLSEAGARRVCLALQQAALSHQRAEERRRQFHLVKG